MQDGGPDGRDLRRPRLSARLDRSSACAALSPTQEEVDRAWGPRPKSLSLQERRSRGSRPTPEPRLEELEEPTPGEAQQIREAMRAIRR